MLDFGACGLRVLYENESRCDECPLPDVVDGVVGHGFDQGQRLLGTCSGTSYAQSHGSAVPANETLGVEYYFKARSRKSNRNCGTFVSLTWLQLRNSDKTGNLYTPFCFDIVIIQFRQQIRMVGNDRYVLNCQICAIVCNSEIC